MKDEFSPQIFEKIHISGLIKIRPMGAKLFHADRQKDRKITSNTIFRQRNLYEVTESDNIF